MPKFMLQKARLQNMMMGYTQVHIVYIMCSTETSYMPELPEVVRVKCGFPEPGTWVAALSTPVTS